MTKQSSKQNVVVGSRRLPDLRKDICVRSPTLRLAGIIGAASLFAGSSMVHAAEDTSDLVQLMDGVWEIRSGDETVVECASGQHFEPASDLRSIDLVEIGTDFAITYRVLSNDERGLQLQREGEERLAEDGNPVKWWAEFDGPDEFRWRRDDWQPGSVTKARWIRCP